MAKVPVMQVRYERVHKCVFTATNERTNQTIEDESLPRVMKGVRKIEANHPFIHGNQIRSAILYDGEFKFNSRHSGDTWRISMMRYLTTQKTPIYKL